MCFITVSTARWCRLRGNLLFYLKSCDQFSEPSGVIVLEKYKVETTNDRKEQDGFVFFLGKTLLSSLPLKFPF